MANHHKEHNVWSAFSGFQRWQYWSIFVVVASEICKIPRNSQKIRTYISFRSFKVISLGVTRKLLCNYLVLINIAYVINEFFAGISAGLPPMDLSAVSDLCDDYSDDFVVDPFEVDKRLSSIKVHKSHGPDGILNWLLRDFSSLLCQPLAAIYNSSIRQGSLPRIWKSAEVVSVPKIHPQVPPSHNRWDACSPQLFQEVQSFAGFGYNGIDVGRPG